MLLLLGNKAYTVLWILSLTFWEKMQPLKTKKKNFSQSSYCVFNKKLDLICFVSQISNYFTYGCAWKITTSDYRSQDETNLSFRYFLDCCLSSKLVNYNTVLMFIYKDCCIEFYLQTVILITYLLFNCNNYLSIKCLVKLLCVLEYKERQGKLRYLKYFSAQACLHILSTIETC